jgi:hypothetical protein
MQRYPVYFIWKLLYMFRVVPPPIIGSAKNCIYSIWYLSHRYCYLPLIASCWIYIKIEYHFWSQIQNTDTESTLLHSNFP